MDYNITFNSVQCLKEVHNWGSNHFMNICNGAEKTVPWGSMDWTGAVAWPIFFLTLGAMFFLVSTVKVEYTEETTPTSIKTTTTKTKKV